MQIQGQHSLHRCHPRLDERRISSRRCTSSRHRSAGDYALQLPCSSILRAAERHCTVPAAATSNLGQHSSTAATAPLVSRRQALAGLLAVSTGPLLFTAPPPAIAAGNAPQGLVSSSADPAVKQALEAALDKVIKKDKAAVVLRLVFHDAGTFSSSAANGGMNASVRFELDRPENFGLKRGWRVIEQLSSTLKDTAAEGTSYADLIALAGAKAVSVCKGPTISVPLGRVDATEASGDPLDRLPAETLTAEQLKKNFGEKGLNVQETVVLLGSHTLGSKGFGDPTTFDNTYFVSLLKKPWLNKDDSMASMIGLASDHVLPDDAECLPFIEQYANDQQLFFTDFSNAYIKLTSLGAVWA